MLDLIKDTFLPVLADLVWSAATGFLFMINLFCICDALGVKLKKDRKVKCWSHISVSVFVFLQILRYIVL